jgi:hypothetical protein
MTAVAPHRLSYRRVAAYVLSRMWPGCTLTRLTLSCAAPELNAFGEAVRTETARRKSQQHLRRWHYAGIVERGRLFVRVLDADALRAEAFGGLPFEPVEPDDYLDVPRTAAIIRRRLKFEQNPALRRLCEVEADLLETLSATGRFEHIYR